MTKKQWKNLWHSYRWMKQFCTIKESLAWIGEYSVRDRMIIEKTIGDQK